jgi:hypothetical protein
MEYLRQIHFARLVRQAPARISLLISLGELKIKNVHGVKLVAVTDENIKRASKKVKG